MSEELFYLTTNKRLYVGGFTKGNIDGQSTVDADGDYFMTWYDTNGNQLGIVQNGTTNIDYPNGIATNGTDVVLFGATFGSLISGEQLGYYDAFLHTFSEVSTCYASEATLADINASASNTLTWFDAQTGGNSLPLTTALVDGTTYYAENNDGANCSSSRTAITVCIDEPEIDTDGDGIPDATDIDDDNDGILDSVECGSGGPNAIADGSFDGHTPTSQGQGGLLPDWFNWNTGTPDLNEQGGFETGWFMFQTPVVGDNYVGMIANGTNKEGLSQNLSSVIASGTNINWTVWAASGQYN